MIGTETSPAFTMQVGINVNGVARSFAVEPRTTLLDALRDAAGLTGPKKSCDRGECGACTVHIDGRRILSCMTLAAMHDGQQITTIEGLERDGQLHPIQQAFIECDGFQCGFCTSGQIMSAVAMIREARAGWPSAATEDVTKPFRGADLSEAEIRERISGNLCRCSCYPIRESDQVALEVWDQGSGMSPARLAQIQSGVSGVGIRGMRERLRQFNGEMKIESDNSGTRILVVIPVPKAAMPDDQSQSESLQAAI